MDGEGQIRSVLCGPIFNNIRVESIRCVIIPIGLGKKWNRGNEHTNSSRTGFIERRLMASERTEGHAVVRYQTSVQVAVAVRR